MTPKAFGLAGLMALSILAGPGGAFGQDKPASDAAAGTYALPAEMLDVTWQWIWFGDGKDQFDVDKPEQYTIQFSADGLVAIQAACNRGRSDFTLAADNRITLSPIALTMMMCPDSSLDGPFLIALERVGSYAEFEGDLLLEAPMDSGTLRFRKAAD